MSLSHRSNASEVRTISLGFVVLAPVAGAAQAQVVTEFSAGITAPAGPVEIIAGPLLSRWVARNASRRQSMITRKRDAR